MTEIKPNHNKNDLSSYSTLMQRIKENHKKSEMDLMKQRVLDNLDLWENSYTKVKGIEVDNEFLSKLSQVLPTRVAYLSEDSSFNMAMGYRLAKALVKLGIPPSAVCITNLNDCYLSIRGFGETAEKKKQIFSPENQLIIIEGAREDRPTDIKDNTKSFMQEFLAHLNNNPDLNVIVIGDSLHCSQLASGRTDTSMYFNKWDLKVLDNRDKKDKKKPLTKTPKRTRFVKW